MYRRAERLPAENEEQQEQQQIAADHRPVRPGMPKPEHEPQQHQNPERKAESHHETSLLRRSISAMPASTRTRVASGIAPRPPNLRSLLSTAACNASVVAACTSISAAHIYFLSPR